MGVGCRVLRSLNPLNFEPGSLAYQLPPPPPPKPPPEDPPPPEELLEGELTRVVLVVRMVSEKEREKWSIDCYPPAAWYHFGGGTSSFSNLSAHFSRYPKARA